MTGDMESLKYVACDLEGSVSISNKQGAFHLPSTNMPSGGPKSQCFTLALRCHHVFNFTI
jgi:hypothetical protein